ncbi:MAG: MCE family protein [Candidatus Melainabacteria bacterium]|nr:MCE family protein [Candidatus Melainabacteria bacterium]
MVKGQDLTKVTIITVLGVAILLFGLFWLKGYKLNGHNKIVVYFKDVSGLEEGAIVRWSGLRVGVVENIKPILKSTTVESIGKKGKNKLDLLAEEKQKKLQELKSKLSIAKEQKEKDKLRSEIFDFEEIHEIYKEQAIAFDEQDKIQQGSCVEVTLVITRDDVPLGPLSRISIVPTGLIGEHTVEITPVIGKGINNSVKFEQMYVTGEPIRFERLLKANIESSEAFRDVVNKINTLLQKDDIELLRSTVLDARAIVQDVNLLIDDAHNLLTTTSSKLEELATSSNQLSRSVVQVGDNVNKIIGDKQLITDLKNTASSINLITVEISKLLGEGGLSNDILEIGATAKNTSIEASEFIKELRETHDELELPKTISNLNSLAEKLDSLTTEVTQVVSDEKIQEDIKVTIQKARETSENLEKMSKKFNKRFLLFRLLF